MSTCADGADAGDGDGGEQQPSTDSDRPGLTKGVLSERQRERAARAEPAAARREHEQWIESPIGDAHARANDNSL